MKTPTELCDEYEAGRASDMARMLLSAGVVHPRGFDAARRALVTAFADGGLAASENIGKFVPGEPCPEAEADEVEPAAEPARSLDPVPVLPWWRALLAMVRLDRRLGVLVAHPVRNWGRRVVDSERPPAALRH